ncbi:MAG: HAD family hydrolase [Desulfocucumaceae bacterium]
MLEAVLFDLDGTLLQMDTGEFTVEYFKEVSRAVAPLVDPARFVKALMESTGAMRSGSKPAVTNSEAFWSDFRPRFDDCIDRLAPVIEDFYSTGFRKLSRVVRPCPGARMAVLAALSRGLRIVLATNPVFPLSAVHQRMAWAGVDDLPWEFVTSYEDMHFCKPHQGYYREIAHRLGLPPEKCLMVGNDMGEDMVSAGVGMKTYLVTDFLVDNGEAVFSPDWFGSLADLSEWLAVADL